MTLGPPLPQAAPLAWASQPDDLPRTLRDRDALEAVLRRLAPAASGALSPIRGGPAAAAPLLEALDPERYGPSRNHLDGAVTRLSPYVRHGIVGLAELRDRVVTRSGPGSEGLKLLQQLAWRDYWQRLWQLWGDGIWENREALKTGLEPADYGAAVPADVGAAQTGLACMDGFIAELLNTGWLHNHARLWLASYLVHWRRVRWQAGAGWFLEHLLDGDPASNNLSWQWVASSFSSKPYIFNRANLERFGAGRHCTGCPAAAACPFEASYEELAARLFPTASGQASETPPGPAQAATPEPDLAADAAPAPTQALRRPILWIHGEALGPSNPALLAHPGRPALFVMDTERISGRLAASREAPAIPLSLKRLGFLYESALALPLSLRQGDVAAEVLAFARRHGADGVVTSQARDPRFGSIASRIAIELPLQVFAEAPFVDLPPGPDLRRFSRYWRQVEPLLAQLVEGSGEPEASGASP